MFNDLVSVVITIYNYVKYLSRDIRSCLSQKHLDVEILVVDDNSNDEYDKVLETFSFLPKEKFRVIKSDKNRGVAHCSNLGLENSIGRFFIRVDSDNFI